MDNREIIVKRNGKIFLKFHIDFEYTLEGGIIYMNIYCSNFEDLVDRS